MSWHPIRHIEAWGIVRLIKRAAKKLPADEREMLVNVLKSFFANGAQIAKLIVLVAGVLTGLHWLPSVTPLLGPLADAITEHNLVAIVTDVLGIFAAAVGLFQGHVDIVEHEEKLLAMSGGSVESVREMRASLKRSKA